MDIQKIRRDYSGQGLDRDQLSDNPIDQFQTWLQQAIKAQINDPTAMVVATVSPEGQPSQRIVLLKHVDTHGFVFYTNLESRKAREIHHNAKVSLHFPWHVMDRQVKICGSAEKLNAAQVAKYFLSRPRDSQIAAAISPQSRVIESRQALMQQFNTMKKKLMNGEVPVPDFWGGFRVKPVEIEFWQGRENRLHDRFLYRLQTEDQWSLERLAP